MKRTMNNRVNMLTGFVTVFGLLGMSCASAPPAKPEAKPYEPHFKYPVEIAKTKADVTVALVSPQFEGQDGLLYSHTSKVDPTARSMVGAIGGSFNELLIAKGFNVAGPFTALADMTFPEKKGADFVFYPVFNMNVSMNIVDVKHGTETSILTGTSATTSCGVKVLASGDIALIVIEPLSGEKMWQKRIALETPPMSVEGITNPEVCGGQGITNEMKNDWSLQHEAIYASLMKNLDKYVTAEEFRVLKTQAGELREKKKY